MSEHRRKPPQSQGGGRAAARRAAQQPSGRRAARRGAAEYPPGPVSEERPYGGRAEARRAAQRGGGGRRRAAGPAAAGAAGGGRRARGGYPDKKRLIDYPRSDRYGLARWVPSGKQIAGCVIGFFGLIVLGAGAAYALVDVPDDPNTAATAQNNVYYWSDNTRMVATGGEVNRQNLSIEKIPKAMQNAVVSAENKTFWHDSGIDPMGIGRAVFNMATGGQTQGGSTITQQYVKNYFLDQQQTLSRKVRELFISIKVGAQFDKHQIMEGYLNTSYYGRGAYGIQAAAQAYYGKDAEKLNASECAFLASLLKGSTYYDPAGATDIDPAATAEANTRRATARWKWILDREVIDRNMSPSDRAKYTKFPRPIKPKKSAELSGQTGYLVDLAKSYVINNTKDSDNPITAEDLAKGGYEIHTTFDKKKVNELKTAVSRIEKANIKPKQRELDKYVQFGGASVNPKNGAIVAIYGGSDWAKHFTNNADETGAQVGSTFKPFVLAAGMQWGVRNPDLPPDQPDTERKKVSQKSLYSGKNKLKIKNYDGSIWQNEKGEQWLQTNDGNESYGDITLREAMRVSANSPYVQLGMDIGTDKVKEAAVRAGLRESSLASSTNSPSFSIGTSSPSAIRMAGAYATFAARGQQHDPYSVTEVKKDGISVFEHKKQTTEAFDQAVADNVTDVLKNVVDKGTGTAAQLPGREVAGKTGTTDGNKSAWFIGYTPQLSTSIGMWRLNDDAKAKDRKFLEMFGTGGQKKIHGASFPAQIWHDYMAEALKNTPPVPFPAPERIGEVVYGGGAASPTPTPTPSDTPSDDASASPSESPSKIPGKPSPSPSEDCGLFDPKCKDGGTTTGGETTSAPTPTESTTDPGHGNGGGNGGIFGGPSGG